MKITLSLLLLIGIFTSCSQNNQNKTADNQNDTASKVSNTDTLESQDQTANEDVNYDLIKKDYISQYQKVVTLDTTFFDKKGNQIKVQTKYFCSFDSALIIPATYNWGDSTNTFKTHNFLCNIQITINKDTIFNQQISKDSFINKLSPQLRKYAVLFAPNFSFSEEEMAFNFHFSISIPLTDVGVGVGLQVDQKGRIELKE